jgi:hypothetical protein
MLAERVDFSCVRMTGRVCMLRMGAAYDGLKDTAGGAPLGRILPKTYMAPPSARPLNFYWRKRPACALLVVAGIGFAASIF